MRHLLTSLALLATFAAAGQSTMPWNPDANDDSYVGATDMLSTLAVYGQQIGIDSSLTCDYDGTPIEEFWGNVWNGDIIIDSMLVQYHTIDSAQVYIAGCPDPVWEVVSYERAWTAPFQWGNAGALAWVTYQSSHQREFRMEFAAQYGWFRWTVYDYEVVYTGLNEVLGSHGAKPALAPYGAPEWEVPFPPEAASLNEYGVVFNHWLGFLSGATYVNILPYWHYAE